VKIINHVNERSYLFGLFSLVYEGHFSKMIAIHLKLMVWQLKIWH